MYVYVRICAYIYVYMFVYLYMTYFLCKLTHNVFYVINVGFPNYMLYLWLLIGKRISSGPIVTDIPKARRQMNQFLSPSGAKFTLFSNASR